VQDGWNRKGLISELGEQKLAFAVLAEWYARAARSPATGLGRATSPADAGMNCSRTASPSKLTGSRPWPTMKSLNAIRSNLSPSAISVAMRKSASWL
jgi:hypothetical protein